jgi:ABC-type polysaccharide/polyol phosphate export permease
MGTKTNTGMLEQLLQQWELTLLLALNDLSTHYSKSDLGYCASPEKGSSPRTSQDMK